MLELTGKYGTARVFTDVVDQASIRQVIGLLNQPFAADAHIRMMPDIHAGAGCTVGTTMRITDKVCPNLVGVDIGCGMALVRLRERDLDIRYLDETVHQAIPAGFAVRKTVHPGARALDLEALRCRAQVDLDRALYSCGTLGGGNHFIEVDRDEAGNLYLVVHSGSRHLGLEIAQYYQGQARRQLAERGITGVPGDLAYVQGQPLEDYLHDMAIAQDYAARSRGIMLEVITGQLGLHVEDGFTTVHNYIDLKHGVLRKGAVSAQAGERLLIPINMRDGSLICEGKGDPDWNWSAPHGAGRRMSRSDAKQSLSLEEYRQTMAGVYTTSVDRGTLDEAPMAYKSMGDIVDNIGDTAEVRAVIRPVYNFKAGGG